MDQNIAMNRRCTSWIPDNIKIHGNQPCNAYGVLQFTSTKKQAQYVRLCKTTSMEKVEHLLVDVWKMKFPKIFLSVTGGAKNFDMQHKLNVEFRKSLIKAAESTGAWIITGGTHTGIMKIVGSAIKTHSTAKSSKITALGISTWGYISNRKNLLCNQDLKATKTKYECKEMELGKKAATLDEHHTHFILVDDGSEHTYGREIDLRSDLESHLASKHNVKVVSVLAEGGGGSLKTVSSAVRRGTPVVVLKGSGRWANILSIICSNSFTGAITTDLILKLMTEQGMDTDVLPDYLALWTSLANQCVHYKNLINIFSLDNPDDIHDLDIAILKAILRADKRGDVGKSHLELALAWNRADIASDENLLSNNLQIKPQDMLSMFEKALVEGKHSFMKLFLHRGLKFDSECNHFSASKFLSLYNLMTEDDPFYHIMNAHCNHQRFTTDNIFCAIRKLMGPQYQATCFCDKQKSHNIIKDLFIWCILQNKKECARELWEAMEKEELPACVIANRLLTGLASHETVKEKKEDLLQHAEIYKNHSYAILTECHRDSPIKTAQVLKRRLKNWGKLTCLQVAADAQDLKFISHPAVQLLLDNVWHGSILRNENRSQMWFSFVVVLCSFIPILVPCLVTFRQLQDSDKEAAQENVENGTSTLSDDSTPLQHMENQPEPKSFVKRHLQNIVSFYEAPVVKFHLTIVSHLVFLVLFAYILLFNFFENGFDVYECVLLVWVIALVIEEYRQVREVAFKDWLFDSGNMLDMISFILYFTGFGLRFYFMDPSRILLSIAFMIFCLRILSTFIVHEKLGPKILMVQQMLKDLFFFIFILLVFVIAYGVASQALLYPNGKDVGKVLAGVFSKPYWNIFGELFLSEIIYDPTAGEFTCTNDTELIAAGQRQCPEINRAVPVFSAVYLLLANVLLLNLLIAMFSYSFDKLVEDTDTIWKNQRFGLVQEYSNRPPLVVPLNIIYYVFFLIKCRSPFSRKGDNPAFAYEFKNPKLKQLTLWESSNADAYLAWFRSQARETVDCKVHNVMERLDTMSIAVDAMRQNLKIQKKVSGALKRELAATNESLRWIISAHTDHKYLPSSKLNRVHVKARQSPYFGSSVKRLKLNDHMLSWNIPLPDYNPPSYTAPRLLSLPKWGDKSFEDGDQACSLTLSFNKFDADNKIDRRSCTGLYKVVDGLPRNPMGRTGLTGRGLLGRYGPNHAADPIVTRWKKDEHGDKLKKNGKFLLEFIAIKREDTKEWAIPGGMVDPGENVSTTLMRKFLEKVSVSGLDDNIKAMSDLKEFFDRECTEIFQGYCDDHRNTDCAWVETIACNFHDEDGSALQSLDFKDDVEWKVIDDTLKLYADHESYIEKIALQYQAYYRNSN